MLCQYTVTFQAVISGCHFILLLLRPQPLPQAARSLTQLHPPPPNPQLPPPEIGKTNGSLNCILVWIQATVSHDSLPVAEPFPFRKLFS